MINEAVSSGARKSKACKILDITLRTLERWEKPDGTEDQRNKVPHRLQANQLTEEERKEVLAIANSKEYCNLPPCKIVPSLADKGLYIASESTFYRILREEKQLKHRQRSQSAKKNKPTEYMAYGPNQVWSWDISYLPSTVMGLFFYLYLILDIYSRKIIGWSIHEMQSSDHASFLIKQCCIDENIQQNQVVLHSDNGKPMKGLTMIAMLEMLGVTPSFSRPSVSDDNPFSESLFKTIKYHPTFPEITKFESISNARIWMEKFTVWYNMHHMHSGLKFVTPQQRHTGADKIIINTRNLVYKLAKKLRPERWSGETRNWELPDYVSLNPNKKPK